MNRWYYCMTSFQNNLVLLCAWNKHNILQIIESFLLLSNASCFFVLLTHFSFRSKTKKKSKRPKINVTIQNTPVSVATVQRVITALTECNQFFRPVRKARPRLFAKDFSFLRRCTWSIQKVHLWAAGFLRLNRSWPMHFTPVPPARTFNTLPSEKKWLITITSGAGSHRLILLHTRSPSPPSQPLHLWLPSCPLPWLFFPVQLYRRSMSLSGHLFISSAAADERALGKPRPPRYLRLNINTRHWLCIRISFSQQSFYCTHTIINQPLVPIIHLQSHQHIVTGPRRSKPSTFRTQSCHFDDPLLTVFVINNWKPIFITALHQEAKRKITAFCFPLCTANEAF